MENDSVQGITNYLLAAGRSSNLPDFDFEARKTFCEASRRDVARGCLPRDIVTQLFKSARASSTDRACEIVISLVTCETPGKKFGLLLLPCSVAKDGVLTCDVRANAPWIPATRLKGKGAGEKRVMVGELAAYWQFRNRAGLACESIVSTWPEALAYADEMFRAVSGCPANEFVRRHGEDGGDGLSIVIDRCYIRAERLVQANGPILEAYEGIRVYSGPLSLFRRLLLADADPAWQQAIRSQLKTSDGVPDARRIPVSALEVHDEFKEGMSLACGFMGNDYPLAESQRLAIHAFLRSGDGDVMAVAGPPGTGKTTMLQAVIANMLVRHALGRLAAPLIVCTSTNNQAITNIIHALGSFSQEDGDAFGGRWLPRAGGAPPEQESMQSIAVYCPAASKVADAEKEGYLVEDLRKSRTYTSYSESRYVIDAERYFRARLASCASLEAVEREASLLAVRDAIHDVLTRLDEDRKKIIECVEVMRSVPKELTETMCRQAEERARREYREAQSRMREWIAIRNRERNPFRRLFNFLCGTALDEPKLIQANSLPGESLSRVAGGLDGVIEHYHQLMHDLDDVCMARKDEHAAYQKAKACSDELSDVLNRLRDMGVLSPEQAKRIFEASSLLDLDKQLDTTLRYAEFWLAVHYYEASWLIVASGVEEGLIEPDSRFRTSRKYMKQYWPQAASLTPCFVMTIYQIPKYFKLYQGAHREDDFDWGRADLLIVDEAGQVDVALGASAFAFAKKAVVVGDDKQLFPIWSFDPESDETRGKGHVSPSLWESMFQRGLTASCPSSVMRAASHACVWEHGAGAQSEPGLFLSEHYRCHSDIIEYCNELSYHGMLKPCRLHDGYALSGAVEHPFCFELVRDSRDRASGSSRSNSAEAHAVVAWIERNWPYLRRVYSQKDVPEEEMVSIVTPFAAQVNLIRKCLKQANGNWESKIRVGTAHRLQGAECPVVLFSSVYGDNDSSMAFISGSPELMNVAVSRARDLFVAFGSQRLWNSDERVLRLVRAHAGKPTVLDFSRKEKVAADPSSSSSSRSFCDERQEAAKGDGRDIHAELEHDRD